MKKGSLFLALLLVLSLLTGCAGTPVVYYSDCTCPTGAHEAEAAPVQTEAAAQTSATEGALKTGLTIVTSVADSKSASAEEAGEAKYDVTMVAVLVDDNGVIQDCIIDGISTSIQFETNGSLKTPVEEETVMTKNELGENYGMVAYGGAVAEWDEQAAALAKFAVGKTVEELRSGAIDESGRAPAGSDLATSATIYLGGYVSAIEAAAANAQHLGAQAGDVLKLATVTGIDSSKAADGENAGNAQLDATVTALTMNGDVISSCVIDAVQAKVAFDASGAVISDVEAPVQTKNELGENYGMVAWGGAIAEWDEQAAALASFAVGKTVEELKSGAIDETGKAPAGSDLATQATIYLGGYVSAIEKAVANAQHLGAQAGDVLKLVAVNEISDSTSATAEAEGLAQLYTTASALTFNGETITSCAIDAVQAKVNFDTTGTVTTDLTAPVLSKNELGENYGMVAYGGAIAEWDAQAAAFASYITGKTAADVASIAVNEKTAPTDADLTASVTIKIGGFQDLIAKAAQ